MNLIKDLRLEQLDRDLKESGDLRNLSNVFEDMWEVLKEDNKKESEDLEDLVRLVGDHYILREESKLKWARLNREFLTLKTLSNLDGSSTDNFFSCLLDKFPLSLIKLLIYALMQNDPLAYIFNTNYIPYMDDIAFWVSHKKYRYAVEPLRNPIIRENYLPSNVSGLYSLLKENRVRRVIENVSNKLEYSDKPLASVLEEPNTKIICGKQGLLKLNKEMSLFNQKDYRGKVYLSPLSIIGYSDNVTVFYLEDYNDILVTEFENIYVGTFHENVSFDETDNTFAVEDYVVKDKEKSFKIKI